MKKIKFNGHYLEMYDSIDEMPITVKHEYDKNVMIDAGIGGDLESISEHMVTMRRHNAKGNKKKMDQVLNNYHQNLVFVVTNTSPKMNAFVALIKTMNGKKLKESDPQVVIRKLSNKGLTYGKVKGFLDSLKKKLT